MTETNIGYLCLGFMISLSVGVIMAIASLDSLVRIVNKKLDAAVGAPHALDVRPPTSERKAAKPRDPPKPAPDDPSRKNREENVP